MNKQNSLTDIPLSAKKHFARYTVYAVICSFLY